ncbi:MAG TPA: hypothetical protein VG323_05960, partial [Thermoanaerobaculia bacterium]|nr:hypothetical protein [Thermoanaerobaculia bacterium]
CEQCDHQTVTDAVATPGAPPDPTSGTPVLHYRSDRSAGRVASRVIDVPVSGASVPQSLLRIETEIAVAGTLTRQTFPPSAGQRYRFTWDGRDVYGRTVQGAAPVSVRTSYVYQGTYERPASSGASFDLASGVSIGIPARSTVTTSAVWLGQLGAWDAAGERMGGFTVAPHHFYDVVSKTLYRGDGTFTTDRPVLFGELSGTVSTIAGTGINDPNWSNVGKLALNKPIGFAGALAVGPDGSLYISSQNYIHRITPAGILERVAGGGTAALPDIGTKAALDAHLSFPRGMAFGPDGSLYVADQFNYIVRRITPDGITSTFAGTGRGAVGPDGVPATNSELARPVDVSVTKDGVVYIVDQGGVVRRVGTDGIITTIAGSNSASGASGDGGPARDALFLRPAAIAVGDDGNVYVEDTDAARIRRIAPDGVVSTFAGNGAYDSTGDTGPAVAASLKLRDTDGNLLAMASDGSLIVPEADGSKIRRIDPAGIITTIAGTGVTQNGPDGSLATGTNLNPPSAVAVAPDGTVYFATSDGLFIRKITPVLPRNTASQSEITVGDGGLVHVFDAAGRHLRTLNRDTGGVLYQFQY